MNGGLQHFMDFHIHVTNFLSDLKLLYTKPFITKTKPWFVKLAAKEGLGSQVYILHHFAGWLCNVPGYVRLVVRCVRTL